MEIAGHTLIHILAVFGIQEYLVGVSIVSNSQTHILRRTSAYYCCRCEARKACASGLPHIYIYRQLEPWIRKLRRATMVQSCRRVHQPQFAPSSLSPRRCPLRSALPKRAESLRAKQPPTIHQSDIPGGSSSGTKAPATINPHFTLRSLSLIQPTRLDAAARERQDIR
jgi:hypothetical protein